MDDNQNTPNVPDQSQDTPVDPMNMGGQSSSSPVPPSPTASQPMNSTNPVSDIPQPHIVSSEVETGAGSPPEKKKKPVGMLIGALLFLVIVFLGLLFFFVFNKPTETQQPVQQVPVQDLEPAEEVATPTPVLDEETVNKIDIGSPEADLSPIDTDLEQLE